ncbi:MAG: hypothetical protein KatS3mg091_384 [Patescibacteria group bacterium]|nr:MAG: hypothetical protein KatS3mg091_384 [Patescibacteria group bacterium]
MDSLENNQSFNEQPLRSETELELLRNYGESLKRLYD